ncbi:uracil-DNA glycosylase family protein [Sphingomicrobium astaxanthinifaciens]|uniref:uracil-DNA glycosylase family protein n=1 Tax=Sphingomicrobium astaxanthinifaciens TaxID=1227949 RepID=UPI001FCA4FD8|nr:uracil-DNA glycosylase family protein [Sphingomicrobium astaxanthinifaciens]MCJ7422350.1 hypothetical protein [Sphingomicrobium astaxanthinifaciens]
MNDGVGIDKAGARALLDWWDAAGVDVAVRERAPSWRSLRPAPAPAPASAPPLTPSAVPGSDAGTASSPAPAPAPPASPSTRVPTPAPAPAPVPDTLEAIEAWLAARSATLGAAHLAAPLPSEPPLLVVGARGEAPEGMTPPARELFERMMAAIGIEAPPLAMIDPAYRPGQPSRAPFDPGLVEALRKRLALARPQRLLLLGEQAARALLEAPLARVRGRCHTVEGARCVATFHPRWLLDRPADKRLAWIDLQLLAGDA